MTTANGRPAAARSAFRQSARRSPRCGLCGGELVGRFRRSSTETVTCLRHPWCEECGAAHLRVPCAEVRRRIVTATQAAPVIRAALSAMNDLDIRLPRVPIDLVGRLPNAALGQCRQTVITRASGIERTAEIRLLRGQGPTRFGHTVVHEHVHALIHLRGRANVDPRLEEGVCEMIAVAWLTRRRTDREYMTNLWSNPDPIYGAQMRRAIAAAQRSGAHAVLDSVLSTGSLP